MERRWAGGLWHISRLCSGSFVGASRVLCRHAMCWAPSAPIVGAHPVFGRLGARERGCFDRTRTRLGLQLAASGSAAVMSAARRRCGRRVLGAFWREWEWRPAAAAAGFAARTSSRGGLLASGHGPSLRPACLFSQAVSLSLSRSLSVCMCVCVAELFPRCSCWRPRQAGSRRPPGSQRQPRSPTAAPPRPCPPLCRSRAHQDREEGVSRHHREVLQPPDPGLRHQQAHLPGGGHHPVQAPAQQDCRLHYAPDEAHPARPRARHLPQAAGAHLKPRARTHGHKQTKAD